MHFELLTQEELITATIATKRPVAFLVGAPLSQQDGVGVPGVTDILEFVRAEIRDRRIDFRLPNFEAELKGKTGGDAYQAAMKWLGRNAGQDAINDVIRSAVLQARKDTAPELSSDDGEPVDWNIPHGTASLGEIAARESERFRGPILTTNFDPLISLAIRCNGGRTGRRVLTSDGTLAGPAEDEICTVIHLHGFWRDSDTLHTQAQLTKPRPKLTKSLQRLLNGRTLIVAAYGGWDDVFTRALVDLMNDEQAPLDVIWCFYEDNVDRVKDQHGKLLAAIEPAMVMNRFRAFGGIDCHKIFDEILTTVRSVFPAVGAPSSISPIAGWELINADYLSALEPLRPEEIIRYFDGATPTLRHAICDDIPTRTDAEEIASRLADIIINKNGCSLQLIRSAGGEGKSTLLLQAAVAAVKSGSWNVLWRPNPRSRLSLEHITTLDPAKVWLIVADDAGNIVNDLNDIVRVLHENGRSNVHFLLSARDTDWRHLNGDRKPWGTWLKRHTDILLRDLKSDDAVMLVRAWLKYGSDGMRELASIHGIDNQVVALLDAIKEASSERDEGSFFGGLLAVRFGRDGLKDHVIDMLNRLKERQVQDSDSTLFDAIVYVAACHAVGIPGISENVLADLVKVPRDWVQTRVVNPLGEEASAVRSEGHVLTRHRKVAAIIIVAAEQDFGVDIAEIWNLIIRQTIKTSDERRIGITHSMIVYAGKNLQRDLPQQFSEQRRKEIAVVAAKANIAAQPNRISALVCLGKTYRNAKDFVAAKQVFRDNKDRLRSKLDFKSNVRSYWYEWSVVEGMGCNERPKAMANAYIGALSLSDHLKLALLIPNDSMVFSGLGVAFGKLAEPRPDCRYALARRAVVYLGRQFGNDPKAYYLDMHDRAADTILTPQPHNIDEAIGWLTSAVVQAGCELEDPFIREILKPEQVSFNMLRKYLKPASNPARAKVISLPTAKPVESFKPLQLRSNLEEKILIGIERVLSQAWKDVPVGITEEERFQIARQKASKIISTLSPHIKRQVNAYFQTKKWGPLKERIEREEKEILRY